MGDIYPSGRNIAVESFSQMLRSLRESAQQRAQSRREVLDWQQRMEARRASEAFRETSLEWQQAQAKERRETEGLRHKEAIDWRKQQATEAKEQRTEARERQARLDEIKERHDEIVLEQQKKEWAAMPPEEKARMVKEKHELDIQIGKEKLGEITGGLQGDLIGGLLKDIRVRLEAGGADEATIQAELTRAAGEFAQMKPADLNRLKEIRRAPIPVVPREASEQELTMARREAAPEGWGSLFAQIGEVAAKATVVPARLLGLVSPTQARAAETMFAAPWRPNFRREGPTLRPAARKAGAPTARARVESVLEPAGLPAGTKWTERVPDLVTKQSRVGVNAKIEAEIREMKLTGQAAEEHRTKRWEEVVSGWHTEG